MKDFIPVTEDELFEVNGRGGGSPSSSSSSSSKPASAGLSTLEKGRIDAVVTAKEEERAMALVSRSLSYGASNNQVGKPNSGNEKSYDCSGFMSAVTGKPYQTTASLMDPKVQASSGYTQAAGNSVSGTWTIVQYRDPSTGKMVGHAQMSLGNGKFVDSVDTRTRNGPTITTMSTQAYLKSQGIDAQVVYLRPVN